MLDTYTDPYGSPMDSFTLIGYDQAGAPVYQGPGGQYYTDTGDPWMGDPSSLQQGDGQPISPPDGGNLPPISPPGSDNLPPSGDTGPISPPGPLNLPPGGDTGPISPPGGGNLPPGGTLGDPGAAPNFYFPEFDAPDYAPIDPFSYEDYTPIESFSYDPFAAPSLEQAQNEPGYAFARDEGQRALANSASARGVTRTGGTLKDILGWGNRFAEQNYGNVFNRAANTYGINRNNAADVWGQKSKQSLDTYGINRTNAADIWNQKNKQRLDTFENLYRGAKDKFSGLFDASKVSFDDSYRRWRDILDANTRIATGPGAQ